jgi:heterodisulfide reductase subunit C
MADPSGFLKYTHRELPQRRPVPLRLKDWNEVYEEFSDETLREQATRCMDCGIPFCHNGCPLGNLIPERSSPPMRSARSKTATLCPARVSCWASTRIR